MPSAMPRNVDRELHNPEVTAKNLLKERTTGSAKRALRGAAGGTYVGPILSVASSGYESSVSHATGIGAGGTEDTTGYRKSDTYRMGTAEDAATATSRPNPGGQTARITYRSNGIFGGSVPGYPAQRPSQRAAAAAGSGLTAEGGAGAFMDKRSNIYGDGGEALGSAGRGTRVLSETVSKGGTFKGTLRARIPAPVIQEADGPAAGTVTVGDGAGVVTGDTHADDITGGANGLAGYTVYVFARDTDTDEDLALVAKGDFDTTTAGNITGLSSLSAATYSCYAVFKDTAGNIGPWSARGTVVVS